MGFLERSDVTEMVFEQGFVDADERVKRADVVRVGVVRGVGVEEVSQTGIGDEVCLLDGIGEGGRKDCVEIGRLGERGVHHASSVARGWGRGEFP